MVHPRKLTHVPWKGGGPFKVGDFTEPNSQFSGDMSVLSRPSRVWFLLNAIVVGGWTNHHLKKYVRQSGSFPQVSGWQYFFWNHGPPTKFRKNMFENSFECGKIQSFHASFCFQSSDLQLFFANVSSGNSWRHLFLLLQGASFNSIFGTSNFSQYLANAGRHATSKCRLSAARGQFSTSSKSVLTSKPPISRIHLRMIFMLSS